MLRCRGRETASAGMVSRRVEADQVKLFLNRNVALGCAGFQVTRFVSDNVLAISHVFKLRTHPRHNRVNDRPDLIDDLTRYRHHSCVALSARAAHFEGGGPVSGLIGIVISFSGHERIPRWRSGLGHWRRTLARRPTAAVILRVKMLLGQRLSTPAVIAVLGAMRVSSAVRNFLLGSVRWPPFGRIITSEQIALNQALAQRRTFITGKSS